jgi:ribokinase
MERPKVVVIGSANMDLVVRCAQLPAPGETVVGGHFVTVSGGKGANQAVAAARLGGEVRFVGRVGTDAFGDALYSSLIADGILPDHLRRDPTAPTGVALIGVDDRGQNAIIVAPGANHQLVPADIDAARDSIEAAAIVMIQLEIPPDTVAHAVALAKEVGTQVLLNPAPVSHTTPLPHALLRQVDVLTPNEHEAVNLLGHATPDGMDMEEVARQLVEIGIGCVVVTLGGDGCILATAKEVRRLPALRVTPVDTTAAGDCFTGALAVALAEGWGIEAAIAFATRAAAISVTRMGAQPSLPIREDVLDFMAFADDDKNTSDPQILHICSRHDWEHAQQAGEYRADSLLTEGFIHFSTPAQVTRTADRFLGGRQGLVLLVVDCARLRSELRYEAADGDLFPHLYGPLNLDAVVAVQDYVPSSTGR